MGEVVSLGYNQVGAADGCTGFDGPGDRVGTVGAPLDVGLAPLGDYGGANDTHGLSASSVGRDAIPRSACTWDDDRDSTTPEVPLRSDQRRAPRPSLGRDHRCDAGAFEAGVAKAELAWWWKCGRGFELGLAAPPLALAGLRLRGSRPRARARDPGV